MNSLNIVSRLTTTPPPSPPRSRTSSSAHMEAGNERKTKSEQSSAYKLDLSEISDRLGAPKQEDHDDAPEDMVNEKTPLLRSGAPGTQQPQPKSRLWQIPKRVAHAILYGATVVFSTLSAPGRYVIACFYDNEGHFSAILPLKNFKSLLSRRKRKSTAQAVGLNNAPESDASEEKPRPKPQHRASSKKPRSPSTDGNGSTASAVTSEDEKSEDSPARHTRSKTQALNQQAEEIAPHRKSGRIKLLPNDEALRKRKIARAQQKKQAAANPEDVANVASALKSPSSTSATSKLTRYPRSPAPPRPLVPRRQPSFTLYYSPETPRKTLIIDLDETLIHSMAKGGRMSTGHMVEVRLGGNYSSSHSSGVALGPGVPILYYVHERPGCHEFLRKMAKWYNLIVFTASVQEYADPVVDWLERERKYFSGRYYRQHCTFRNGAYIKDLAQVEPDLSKVMILDNSPMSYIFHEDNAIPIEGWISDPTDHELLHLVPLLEGLQYVTDVRALLALRQGQAQQA
ncbi:Nuclear envelope morphology protein 1 [Friedmanniomyces endolithicus]|uniref:Nuclear envelope morphology protein 1 n=2 Tax=Friedmanniomyces endolithicus TaxID=329885 RepID=A0AAN6L193_9PEZI|nr:Nuclear envelope morphology protein 1 [Friedmanniomyces endolithicus]KAK0975653.1 Nuclear envelope morphology protein 1 [Friedmanniomyces endolithicus]KAK1011675.1 Nuclear envelope morphology protein 1 [Friedmanniomyces endolithicus]KAK1015774.1 Nuclear envelope morphology protein 1 [Friedmanniomyces endolithicus]